MEENIGLWIAVIGAGSAILGTAVSQFFTWIMRRLEYRQEHLKDYYEKTYRIP
jgi:uncharacterized membrane protein YidH (DUF202 family)